MEKAFTLLTFVLLTSIGTTLGLTAQNEIQHIAYPDEDSAVRLAALKQLNDQNAIRHIAFTDADKIIRLAALKILNDKMP